ncbi:MAG: L-2-hydroxyglutarate oxidase, partial [Ardenticatenales bacterium]
VHEGRGRAPVRVVVLEAEDHVAAHQTGHNSGVIHSGLYYAPGSLKARLCAEGREAMFDFCAANGIPVERCGKLVVATRADELPRLDALEARGRANGLVGLRRLGAGEIAAFEPHAVGLAALWVPETGVTDYGAVAAAFARVIVERGGTVHLGHRLTGVRREPDGLVLATTGGEVRAGGLIACAGLHADRVAALCGVEAGGVRIVPFRGEYHRLVGPSADLVRHLIYPVPDPRFPFLGVHFTRGIDGAVHVGPNAILALARHGYRRGAFDAGDAAAILSSPAVWRMAARYWRIGAGEIVRSWSRRALARSLQAMVPDVRAEDLVPAGAGVRAQALEPSGALVDDFRIVEGERMIHVLNAPSPAATASIGIGRYIAERAAAHLGLA